MGITKEQQRTCEHGARFRHCDFEGPWAGGVSECSCCYSPILYVDSASYDGNGLAHSTTWTPKDRCAACGGKYVTVP